MHSIIIHYDDHRMIYFEKYFQFTPDETFDNLLTFFKYSAAKHFQTDACPYGIHAGNAML